MSNKENIYLDHAATTYVYPEVIEYMYALQKEEFGNPSSIHKVGRRARTIIEQARKIIANEIKASVGEIFFTSSATEANNTVLTRSVVDHNVRRIISSPTEHHCVIHSLDKLRHELGIQIEYLDVNSNGEIDVAQLEACIKKGENIKTLVSLMYGNNELGTIHPIDEISQLCVKYNCLFHVDGVQVFGKQEIDVQKTNFSFLTASAHKFHGPKGIGMMYINNANIIAPMIVGGAQERNMRAGTENLIGIAGMAKALEVMIANRNSIMSNLSDVQTYFEGKIASEFDKCYVNAQKAKRRMPHVSSISFPNNEKADMLMFNLDINGICVSSGSACSSGIEADSHVLQAIGHPKDRKTVRFSFAESTTKDDIDYVIQTLHSLDVNTL